MQTHNFADNNTLRVFAKTIHELLHSLKLKSEIAVRCIPDTLVNPDKFKPIVITKNKSFLISKDQSDYIPCGFSIGNGSVTVK